MVLRYGVRQVLAEWKYYSKKLYDVLMCKEGSLLGKYFSNQKLHTLKFQDIFELKIIKQMHLYFHNMTSQAFRKSFVSNEDVHHYNTAV